VAVLFRHLGFWSLNGARLLVPYPGRLVRTPSALRTERSRIILKAAKSGFEVFLDPTTGDVVYRLRAVSWPQAFFAYVGYPIVRMLQARFRRDSAAAMKRATSGGHFK
jgi:hypothetical protein